MNHCIGSIKHLWKYALDSLVVLEIWLIQVETNLTQVEIKSFEEARFVINR